MAKVLGLNNPNIKGKLGTSVFYTRKGQNLVRSWQPNVTNPKTELQIRQRSKLSMSVELNRQIRERVKTLIGTGEGKYEYQGIQKVIMNSAIIKQYQTPTNGASGTTRAAFLSGLNLKNITKGVGDNYTAEKLNIFEPGVTVGINNTITANGNVQIAEAIILSLRPGGIAWNRLNYDQEGQYQYQYVFGCDYELGNKLYLISVIPSGTAVINQGLPSLNITELDVTPVDISGAEFQGTRVRGLSMWAGDAQRKASALNRCGTGWKYYYNLGHISSNVYIGTGITVQGLINGSVQSALLYNYCFVLATANTDSELGIQVLKGVSYNSYTSRDETAVEE